MTDQQLNDRIDRIAESARFGPAQLKLSIKSLVHDIRIELESQVTMQRAANQDLQGTNVKLHQEYEKLLKDRTV